MKKLGWEKSIVLNTKNIDNLKSLKCHRFVVKHYFFLVFVHYFFLLLSSKCGSEGEYRSVSEKIEKVSENI